MRVVKTAGLVGLLLLLAGGDAAAQYTGAGGVWWSSPRAGATGAPKYNSKNAPGTRAGIQEAFDSVGVGGQVLIMSGRYSIDATLRLLKDGVRVVCQGDSVVFENTAANGDTLLQILGDNTYWSGGTFDGRRDIKTEGYGIHVEADDVTLEKIWVRGTPDGAVHTHIGSDRFRLVNSRIDGIGDAGSTAGYGVIVHDSHDAKLTGNSIEHTKHSAVWVQGTSQRTLVSENHLRFGDGTSLSCDAVLVDNTAKFGNVVNNVIDDWPGSGVTANGDSMIVAENSITRCDEFGIWSVDGGNGSSWWGNLLHRNGNYNMGIEVTNGVTYSGWAIFSNFMMRPYGQHFEIQSSNASSVVRDVQFSNNYLIGPTLTLGGTAHPALKLVPTLGGLIDRVHYTGNVVKDPTNYGFQVTPITTGQVTGLVLTDNHFIGGRFGVRLQAGGSGNTAHISGNFYNGQSVGAESLDVTTWSVDQTGIGERILKGDRIVAFDTLRVNGSTVLLGPVTMPPPTFTDVTTVGKITGEDSLRIGTSSQTAPAIITGATTLYDKLTVYDSLTVVGVNGTAPSLRVTQGNVLVDDGDISIGTVGGSGSADELKFGDTIGHVKAIAGTGELHFGAGGVNSQVVLEADGDLRVDLGKLTVVDSLRSNGPIVGDQGIRVTGNGFVTGAFNIGSTSSFTKEGGDGNVTIPSSGSRINFSYTGDNFIGPTVGGGGLALTSNGGANKTIYLPGTGDEVQANGKLIGRDSLRFAWGGEIGTRTGGNTDTLRIGRNMAFVKYGTTSDIIIQNNGTVYECTNDGNCIFRASDAAGTISFQTGGTSTRFSVPTTGGITINSVVFSSLGTPANGTFVYCSDCAPESNPCTASSTGAFAKRLNGAWDCR